VVTPEGLDAVSTGGGKMADSNNVIQLSAARRERACTEARSEVKKIARLGDAPFVDQLDIILSHVVELADYAEQAGGDARKIDELVHEITIRIDALPLPSEWKNA
jgi:hypothetical protein